MEIAHNIEIGMQRPPLALLLEELLDFGVQALALLPSGDDLLIDEGGVAMGCGLRLLLLLCGDGLRRLCGCGIVGVAHFFVGFFFFLLFAELVGVARGGRGVCGLLDDDGDVGLAGDALSSCFFCCSLFSPVNVRSDFAARCILCAYSQYTEYREALTSGALFCVRPPHFLVITHPHSNALVLLIPLPCPLRPFPTTEVLNFALRQAQLIERPE